MIPTPSYINLSVKQCPANFEITVYDDDYKKEITNECKFRFSEEEPEYLKLSKNKIVISNKPKPFKSDIYVSHGSEEKTIGFSITLK